MTTRLNQAFAEAEKLPAEEQDALAEWLLHEITAERKWRDLLTRSQRFLGELAAEAEAEYLSGRTEPLDPDRM